MSAASGAFRGPSKGKVLKPLLSLVPRLAERDEQVAKSTLSSFRHLLQGASIPGEAQLFDLKTKISGEIAESLLDLCVSSKHPRGLVHLTARLDPGVQYSPAKSKLALLMMRQTGDLTDLRQLCRLTQRASVASAVCPFGLDSQDIHDLVTTCLSKGDTDLAVKWFISSRDTFQFKPLTSTYSLILPDLIRSRNWEYVYFILAEMELLDIPISYNVYEMLLRGCEFNSPQRWSFMKRCFFGLLNSRETSADKSCLLKSICATLTILNDANQFEATLNVWDQISHSTTHGLSLSHLLQNAEVLRCVGRAAIKLRREDVVIILMETNFNQKVRGEYENLMHFIKDCLCTDSNRLIPNFGALRGIGLGWLWAENHLDAAERIYIDSELLSSSYCRGETIRILAESLHECPANVLKSLTETLSNTLANENGLPISSAIAENLITLFGKLQNSDATALVLLQCTKQNVKLNETAFTVASHTVLRDGQYTLVLQMLESYLEQEERSGKHSTKKMFYAPRVFSPALQALSKLGDLDGLFRLLLQGMPRWNCLPNAPLFVVAINACYRAGRYEDGVKLFDEAIIKERNGHLNWHERDDLSALVSSALNCCAKGRLGAKALEICAWLDEKHPQFYETANDEMRNLKLVARAMANRDSINMLPTLIGIVSGGDRAVQISRQLFVCCLAAALTASDSTVYQSILSQPFDREIRSDIENIKISAQKMAERWMREDDEDKKEIKTLHHDFN